MIGKELNGVFKCITDGFSFLHNLKIFIPKIISEIISIILLLKCFTFIILYENGPTLFDDIK